MLPPALEVGVEFEQTQPVLKTYDTKTVLVPGTPPTYTFTAPKTMQAWKIRAKLRGRANVKINSRFNINKLFYNDFTFELDELIAFLFGDLFIIYKLSDKALT